MSFLGGIFDRKPGGTFVGNLLRTASSTVANTFIPGSGQFVGTGAGEISQQEYDAKHLSDADYGAKYGVTKTGAVVHTAGGVLNPNIYPASQGVNPATGLPWGASSPSVVSAGLMSFFTKNWIWFVVPGGLFILVIMFGKSRFARNTRRKIGFR